MTRSYPVPATVFRCCLVLLVFATPAYAYIDPNATGLISQLVTPLLIAAAASLTFLRKRLGAALGRMRRRSDAQ
jgi:hypothetical protein